MARKKTDKKGRGKKKQTGKSDRKALAWKYARVFIFLMIGVEGLDLTVTANKLVSVYPFMWGVGLLMVIAGFTGALYTLKPELFEAEIKKAKPPRKIVYGTISERIMRLLTVNGRLTKFYPVIGILLIVIDIAYNFAIEETLDYEAFGSHDIIALLFAGILVMYPYIPSSWSKERDFAFFFAVGLVVFLVIPLLLIRAATNEVEGAVDVYAAFLLAKPLEWILTGLGIYAHADGINLEFALRAGGTATVGITTSCSGIYSFTIFSAAFASFVIVEYKRFESRVFMLLVAGIITAYFANLLRMLIITLVGHSYDTTTNQLENFNWAHANAGWLIFLLWIALFWWIVFRFGMRGKIPGAKGEQIPLEEIPEGMVDLTREIYCESCGAEVDRENIPEECPECGQKFEIELEEE
jgi:archaeosortase C (PEF-CTERM variant)